MLPANIQAERAGVCKIASYMLRLHRDGIMGKSDRTTENSEQKFQEPPFPGVAGFREDHDAEAENAILKGMVAASTDACWCMEFGEPVDLTAPDREVIRQIFENDPYWRFCNDAMARLYRLPVHLDINDRPVSEIFPRNKQNEAFIENLLSSGFAVDAAPALDSRYDGSELYVENDVRAHIEGGRLIRIFGVVRDVSKHRRREIDLKDRLVRIRGMLSALPDALIAFDDNLAVLAANPAAGLLLGAETETLPGTTLPALFAEPADATGEATAHLRQATRRLGDLPGCADIVLPLPDGRKSHWRIGMEGSADLPVQYVSIIRLVDDGVGEPVTGAAVAGGLG